MLKFREYQDTDFVGLKKLWADAADWGELTETQVREWYVDIPDGPAILIVGEAEDGDIGAMATLTPHRVALRGEIIPAARLQATVVADAYQKNVFDLMNHPLVGMLLECRAASHRRGIRLLFGLPKVSWMSILKFAARAGFEVVPYTDFSCLEMPLDASYAAGPFGMTNLDAFTGEHVALWQAFRTSEEIACAVDRDLEMLNFRNGPHLKVDCRDEAGALAGFAAIRRDGLVFDLVPARLDLIPSLLASLAAGLADQDLTHLKILHGPWMGDLGGLPFAKTDYKFGFVSDALDPALAGQVHPSQWYLAGGG